jgi:hypothetical protein
MINEGTYVMQFYDLVWDAITDPDQADTNALLLAANDVLDTLHSGDPVLVPMVRALAEAAMYWAVFGRHHEVLRVRAHDFYQAFARIHPADA